MEKKGSPLLAAAGIISRLRSADPTGYPISTSEPMFITRLEFSKVLLSMDHPKPGLESSELRLVGNLTLWNESVPWAG